MGHSRQTEIKKQKPHSYIRPKTEREGLAVVSLSQVSIRKKEKTGQLWAKLKCFNSDLPIQYLYVKIE